MRKKRKFNKTKEWLIQEYVINDRSRLEIAAECGLSEAGLKSLLLDWNIKKEKLSITKEKLEMLVNNLYNVEAISQLLKCNSTTIYRYLHKYNLHILAEPTKYEQYDSSDDNLICDLYLEGHSTTDIAKLLNTTHSRILKHLRHCGVKVRTLSEAQFAFNNKIFPEDLKNKDIIYELYISQKLSKKDLGKMYNCDAQVIDRILKKFNIPIRGSRESKIGLLTGEDHWNWKGGITTLHMRLREAFNVQLTPLVRKRDHYTCQLCGSKKKLHIHHIRPFIEILKEIIEEHPELDVVKDINELYDICVKDPRFLDLDNLITYCKDCHLYKIHKYNKT